MFRSSMEAGLKFQNTSQSGEDAGSIPAGTATADSAAINIDVPVQIRPRYLVYVSPWDIKIAEETTDISRRDWW